jgi:excisionase family DNA binding protein
VEQLLLRPEEAARALGISRTKLFELIASGEIESIRIGRARRIPADVLEDWVARRRTQADVVGGGGRRERG